MQSAKQHVKSTKDMKKNRKETKIIQKAERGREKKNHFFFSKQRVSA